VAEQMKRKENMDIVLQSKKDSAFVRNQSGEWTSDPRRAHVFLRGLDALAHCWNRRLNDMQMVVRFTDSRMNFTVAIANTLTA